jgi:hypothetical protein
MGIVHDLKNKEGLGSEGPCSLYFSDFDGEKRAREIIIDLGGTIPGSSTEEMAQHLLHLASLRPLLRKNAAHLILRWTSDDNPSVVDQQQMAKLHAEALGFLHWRAASHGDHLHIAASRINADGSVVPDSNDFRRGEESRAELERLFQLVQVPPSHLRDQSKYLEHVRAPTQEEMALAETGTGSVRGQLQEAVLAVLDSRSVSLPIFVQRLNAIGVDVQLNVAATNRIAGISFSLDGIVMKGSSLGRSFSWPNLQRRGVTYDIERDLESIQECISRHPDGQDSPVGGNEHRADRGNESRSGADRRATPAACELSRSSIRRRESIVDNDEFDGGDFASGLLREDRGGDEKGGKIADVPLQRDNASARSSLASRELRQGNRSTSQAGSSASRHNRGDSSVSATDNGRVGHCSSHRESSPATFEGAAGDVEAFDGSETAEQALQKWSRNMARQIHKFHSAGGGLPPTSTVISPFSGLRRIADLANVETYGDPTAEQILRQIRAFGCDRVEIGVLPPRHRKDLLANRIRTFSGTQLGDPMMIKWLKRMNAMDHDIFVRPAERHDGCVEPLVLVDDLTKDGVQRLEKAGLPLAILIESSPANFHGWVRISDGPISQEQALSAARILAADFGGDPGAVGSRQFGRLAGFTNRKAKYHGGGKAPFARLRASQTAIAPMAVELLSRIRALIQQEGATKLMVHAQSRAATELGGSKYVDNAVNLFVSKRSRSRVTRSDGSMDDSAADFAAAAAMLDAGWHVDAITYAIVLASPRLAERHRDIYAYASRTVSAAASMRPHHPVPSFRPKR